MLLKWLTSIQVKRIRTFNISKMVILYAKKIKSVFNQKKNIVFLKNQ
jgi:hypothetical protein